MGFFSRRQDVLEKRLDILTDALNKLAHHLDENAKKPEEESVGKFGVIVGQMTESIGRQLMSMSEFVEHAVQSQSSTFQRQVDLLGALDARDAERERREADRKEALREERRKRALERQAQGRDANGRILPKPPSLQLRYATGECPGCAFGENASMTREQTIAHMQHRQARAAHANGAAVEH